MLGAYLGTLQADLVVARAYQVEIDALGAEARTRRRDSLNLFAAFLQEVTARVAPGAGPTSTRSAMTFSAGFRTCSESVSQALP